MTPKYIVISAAIAALALTGCKKDIFKVDDSTVDPNLVPVEVVLASPSKAQIIQLSKGLESAMRNGYRDYLLANGAVGREVIFSAATEPRYYGEILGTQTAQFGGANDPSGIFNGYYSSFSQTRRRAELLARTANNATTISEGEKKGVEGFARTIQAFVTLNLLNMQGKNGIRETFSDLNVPGDLLKPGKFGTYESGLALVKKYVDDGYAALNSSTAVFPFVLSKGWRTPPGDPGGIAELDFQAISNFKKFNRAVAARVAMYQKDWAGVLAALNESYLDLTGSLTAGPKYVFSTAANDVANTMFVAANNNNNPFVVFNEVIAEAEAGDRRIFGATAKVGQRTNQRSSGAFTSTHEVRMYTSNTSSASIIRNEELILMYAEAKAQQNTAGTMAEAITAINRIRTAYSLAPYAGAVTRDALIDEILKQRRYSLFWEGHRWFDMRRYNRLADIKPSGTISGNNYVVFEAMARPDAEVQWDKQNP
jgi:hypothetical protein